VSLERFPELEREGGLVKVITEERGPVLVRQLGGDRFLAVSGVCPHQGCTVEPAGDGFSCPCHGSSFDQDGVQQSGPARRPLTRFSATRLGDLVVLRLVEAGR
jgi:Rieske Fe-S protein